MYQHRKYHTRLTEPVGIHPLRLQYISSYRDREHPHFPNSWAYFQTISFGTGIAVFVETNFDCDNDDNNDDAVVAVGDEDRGSVIVAAYLDVADS